MGRIHRSPFGSADSRADLAAVEWRLQLSPVSSQKPIWFEERQQAGKGIASKAQSLFLRVQSAGGRAAVSHPTPHPGLLPAGRLLSGPGLVGGSTLGPAEPHGRLRRRPPHAPPPQSYSMEIEAPAADPAALAPSPAGSRSCLPGITASVREAALGPSPMAACTQLSSAADLPHFPPQCGPHTLGASPAGTGLQTPRDLCCPEAAPLRPPWEATLPAPHPEHSHQRDPLEGLTPEGVRLPSSRGAARSAQSQDSYSRPLGT